MNFEQLRTLKFASWLNKTALFFFQNNKFKQFSELWYWRIKKLKEKEFNHSHYAFFFTEYFNIKKSFYQDKKMLDIGCGPRGSLEWATMAEERIGLDPLAEKYKRLNQQKHSMQYVKGNSEAIPFGDGYFDVVSSFNSLDHVDNLQNSIDEISRVLKPGGLFLLIVDIHEEATITEPIATEWDIINLFQYNFQVIEEKHFEGHRMYKSIRAGIPFDHQNPKKRYGVLTAVMQKHN